MFPPRHWLSGTFSWSKAPNESRLKRSCESGTVEHSGVGTIILQFPKSLWESESLQRLLQPYYLAVAQACGHRTLHQVTISGVLVTGMEYLLGLLSAILALQCMRTFKNQNNAVFDLVPTVLLEECLPRSKSSSSSIEGNNINERLDVVCNQRPPNFISTKPLMCCLAADTCLSILTLAIYTRSVAAPEARTGMLYHRLQLRTARLRLRMIITAGEAGNLLRAVG